MLKFLVRPIAVAVAVVAATAAAIAATPLREINVSYVDAPFNLQIMVMRKQGLLEKEFAGDGVTINWHTITSGAQQTQAMAAGSLDIGGVLNTTSILLANAGGNPVMIMAGVSRPADTFAIMGRPGGPTSIEDLKGKTVVGPRGTVLHQLLAAALASKGMALSDVDFVGMDLPKSMTALVSGQVDAALLAASLKIKAEAAGASVIATADGLVNPVLVMGVRKGFADDYPEAVARVQKVNRQTTDWVLAHLDEATAIGAAEQGIALDDARKLAAWGGFTATLTARDVASIKDDIRFLDDNGMMKGTVDVDALMVPGVLADDHK